jgi:hypothetical protein
MIPNGADVMRKPCNFLILADHLPDFGLERRRDPATRRINSADRMGPLARAVQAVNRSSDRQLIGVRMRRCFLNGPAARIGVIANAVESS